MLSTKLAVISLPAPLAASVNVEPVMDVEPVVLPAVKVEAAVEASIVFPVEPSVVNAPVEAVVAPIAVVFIPVAVVLKFPEVMIKLFTPVEIEDAPNPDNVKAPEVAVKFKAPVV